MCTIPLQNGHETQKVKLSTLNQYYENNPELAWKLQMYGPKILMLAILIGMLTPFSLLGVIMNPFIKFFMYLFAGI